MVPVGQVFDEFKQSFEDVVSHKGQVNLSKGFSRWSYRTTRVLQIDYTMAYQYKYQNEIQIALWSRESVNLFMCAVFHQSITKTLLICTNYKGKDKFANGAFLEHLYAHEILQDENVVKEVIWSNGPTPQFKNKFMRQLLENLSKKCSKQFLWKFTETSHGKGVADRVGGNVKWILCCCILSKGKNPIIIQDCESFLNAARNLIKIAKILHVDEAAIIAYKNTNPFDNTCDVTGISKMHVMQVS